MTITEMLAAYGIFAVSGAITMIFIIYLPAIQIVRRLNPQHPLLWIWSRCSDYVCNFFIERANDAYNLSPKRLLSGEFFKRTNK